MKRFVCSPRQEWQAIVEAQGLVFHTANDLPYWDESAFYAFKSDEVDEIERASYALNDMCLDAVEHVIANARFEEFEIPDEYQPFVVESWERDEHTIYGRFDLAVAEGLPPRLLEYNADTPTALIEAAVIQWHWFNDIHPQADQFNSIHERLIESWRSVGAHSEQPVYFAFPAESDEDFMTVTYLRETAMQAGLATESIVMHEIGWNSASGEFRDLAERPMRTVFKLYPWEWMIREPFGPMLLKAKVTWLEAPWKMLLSNKAILPVLWELYPESPYLLPASFAPLEGRHVRKPRLSREGANVALFDNDQLVTETPGDYDGPCVYQSDAALPTFDGLTPVVGSWIVNGYSCGVGIRESNGPVTQNTSRFVPHVILE